MFRSVPLNSFKLLYFPLRALSLERETGLFRDPDSHLMLLYSVKDEYQGERGKEKKRKRKERKEGKERKEKNPGHKLKT